MLPFETPQRSIFPTTFELWTWRAASDSYSSIFPRRTPIRDRLVRSLAPELCPDVLDVNLYGFFRDEEFFSDVAIPVSPGNSAKDFYLASVKSSSLKMFRKPRRQLRGDALFPAWTWRITSTSSLGGMLLSI